MLRLACLWLAVNDGNGNTIQLKLIKSAFYPPSAVHKLRFILRGFVMSLS